jgi:hypothetical protein
MRLKLLFPRLLILRLALILCAFAALWWGYAAVVSVLFVGCEQLYGAAFLCVSVFFYVLAIEVKGWGDRIG